MNKHLKYLILQKLIGVAMLVISIILAFYGDGDITYTIITMPVGIFFVLCNFVFIDSDDDDEVDKEERK